MSNADELRAANPWQPMTSPIDLKHLGKLAEELGEAAAAVSRCIIQGIDEREPVTGKLNREWLEDEIADVNANMALVIAHFSLDPDRMHNRCKRKMEHLRGWHEQLSDTQPATCSHCNGTGRAIYFSEQGWKQEDRDCHVCRPLSDTQRPEGK